MPRRVKWGRFYGVKDFTLTTWRRQQKKGALEALSPKHRGPKEKKSLTPSDRRIVELEKENRHLKEKLKQAETIIDVQKKLSEILRIPLDPTGEKI